MNESKHTFSSYNFATYCEKVEELKKGKSVEEETDNPNYRQGQRKIDSEKRAGSKGGDGKDAKGKTDSSAQKQTTAKQRRDEKEKERDSKKLMPYEYTSQKEAERAASHLGLHGSHTSGNGIYKPGSSEYSLRDAVHRKKDKQKMRGGHGARGHHSESVEGLSTGVGIANPEQVLSVVKRVVRGDKEI
jgi:hypothetical protein